jgi:phospholipid/cholesterol/gamma-HCH transport system substrate-binding protein
LTERPVELSDLVKQTESSLRRIDSVSERAEQGLGEINAIAALIHNGEGSLGRLVKDEDAYRNLMAMSERGRKAFGELEENLTALKRTWPLSRYFETRAFYDIDRVLYQPGAERESRTLRDVDLFEPGRAVLTLDGRRRLDEVAAWFNAARRPRSTEVVIAAFTDDHSYGDDLALILTQEQANSVRRYLVARYAIDTVGWFRTRKVAAVGFGTHPPRVETASAVDRPSRRVEIIVFTPQT